MVTTRSKGTAKMPLEFIASRGGYRIRFRVNFSEWTGPSEEKGSEPKPLLAGFFRTRLVAAVGTAGIIVRDRDICLCHRV
jgi:hypothetical protein